MNNSDLKKAYEHLQLQNKGALRELDKVTEQLAEAQKIATKLKEKLEKKKYSEQLCGWAFDRATEVAKHHKDTQNLADIFTNAESILGWVDKISTSEPEEK